MAHHSRRERGGRFPASNQERIAFSVSYYTMPCKSKACGYCFQVNMAKKNAMASNKANWGIEAPLGAVRYS